MGVPTFLYRRGKNGIEAEIFDSDSLPDGWVDSPAKVDDKPEVPAEPVKRGRKRAPQS